jgi:hypothetical protein
MIAFFVGIVKRLPGTKGGLTARNANGRLDFWPFVPYNGLPTVNKEKVRSVVSAGDRTNLRRCPRGSWLGEMV